MDTRVESQIVTDQSWSFHGPCRDPKVNDPGPYNFQAYFRASLPFLQCTLSSPSHHFGTLFWSLWNSIRARGTLLDPQMNPTMDPARLISGDPWQKRALQGPFMVQTDQFFYIGLSTKDKLKFTAQFEVNPTFGSREIRLLKPGGPFGPPPV